MLSSAARTWVNDWVFRMLCLLAALLVPTLVVLLVFFLFQESWLGLRVLGLNFFFSCEWDSSHLEFGALPFAYGTLVTSILAMLIAVPISVGAAAYLAEIAPNWLRHTASFLIELLAAIPSVVYGFWGIFFLVPVVQWLYGHLGIPNTSGRGVFTAGLILAIMIVPYIAALTYDVCRAVPRSQREGALALGATRWQTIHQVVLPYARPGIVGACFLALGRALGETMAVAMLIGNRAEINLSPFALGYSIPSVIANELGAASRELHKSALIELGLVLFLVTAVINALARWLPLSAFDFRRATFRRSSPRSVSESLTEPAKAYPIAEKQKAKDERYYLRMHWMDQLMTVVLGLCLIIALIPLFHILSYITVHGLGAVNKTFFTHWPQDDPPGLGHSLIGSGILVALATAGAVPIGILAALFLTEFRTNRLANWVRFLGELLGGVPSIVIGIFAYALLVRPYTFSAWAGSLALGVMMIPIVMRSSEEALKLVPASLRNASYALGASQAQTVLRVLVPSALPTIVTGVFLAIARIAGETAPLLFTAGNSDFLPTSLSRRTPFLTYYIYTYSLSEDLEEQRQAWAGALVLLALVMAINVGIRLLTGKRVLSASRAD